MAKSYLRAHTIDDAAYAYYSKPDALRSSFSIFAPVNYLRGIAQGACAGLLTLIGTRHLTAPIVNDGQASNTLAGFDSARIESLVEASLSGGLPGIIEIMGAAALFLSAGRGSGRLLGLLGFVAILIGHTNGITQEDLFQQAGELMQFVQQTAQKIQMAQNV